MAINLSNFFIQNILTTLSPSPGGDRETLRHLFDGEDKDSEKRPRFCLYLLCQKDGEKRDSST